MDNKVLAGQTRGTVAIEIIFSLGILKSGMLP
jgi:hypothetical protein